jgi:hypothetical protein
VASVFDITRRATFTAASPAGPVDSLECECVLLSDPTLAGCFLLVVLAGLAG